MPERASALSIIVAAALVAAVAGLAAALMVAAYVLPPTVPDAGGTFGRAPTPDTADVAALGRAADAVVRIYAGPGTATPVGGVYAPEALRGAAVVLTADGWLAADRTLWNAAGGSSALVTSAGRRLLVADTVDAPGLGLVFLKTDGRDVNVARFGDSRGLAPGTDLYAPAADGLTRLTLVTAAARDGAPAASETTAEMRRRLHAAAALAPLPGGPLLSARGELVGLALSPAKGRTDNTLQALPAEVLRLALNRVLSAPAAVPRFPDIGARGLPISAAAVPAAALAAREGWFVTEVRSGGLKAGDVVRSVGSDPVTASRPLGEILADYPAEARPELLVLRAGQEIRIPVSLNER